MGHWQDVGGTLRGTTTDIYEEGLQMPIVKIYREGVVNQELVEIIKTNVRFPDLAMGDFRAQVASIKTGERRLLELLERYGRDAVLGSIHRSSATATRWRARRCRRSRTASTRRIASWTTTACGWASASRSTSR